MGAVRRASVQRADVGGDTGGMEAEAPAAGLAGTKQVAVLAGPDSKVTKRRHHAGATDKAAGGVAAKAGLHHRVMGGAGVLTKDAGRNDVNKETSNRHLVRISMGSRQGVQL